jgi:glutamate synthase domain-containing protein 2
MLVGYGVSAVNPYLVFEALEDMTRTGQLNDIPYEKAVTTYKKTVAKGIVKVMSKRAFQTLQGYQAPRYLRLWDWGRYSSTIILPGLLAHRRYWDREVAAECRARHLLAFST